MLPDIILFLDKKVMEPFYGDAYAAPPLAGKKSVDSILGGCGAKPLSVAC